MARKPLEGKYFNDTDLRTRDRKNAKAGKKGIISRSPGTDTAEASFKEQKKLNDQKLAKAKASKGTSTKKTKVAKTAAKKTTTTKKNSSKKK